MCGTRSDRDDSPCRLARSGRVLRGLRNLGCVCCPWTPCLGATTMIEFSPGGGNPTAKTIQTMAQVEAESAQRALDMIQKALGRREGAYPGRVTIRNRDPLLASRHRFGELMAAAQASLGMCLGDIWQRRGGAVQDVTPMPMLACTSTMASPTYARMAVSLASPITARRDPLTTL